MMLSLVWPIASLGFLLSMTQESMTAANRIAEIFDAPREIDDGPRPQTPRGGRLELVDVGFRFPPTSRKRLRRSWALRHVDVTVEPGETLALVGRHRIGQVGAGRAAVAAVRRHRGRDPHRRPATSASCRCPRCAQAVATAFEDPTLFSMSVAENLRLGRRRRSGDRRRAARKPSRSRPRSSSTTCRSDWTPGSASRA